METNLASLFIKAEMWQQMEFRVFACYSNSKACLKTSTKLWDDFNLINSFFIWVSPLSYDKHLDQKQLGGTKAFILLVGYSHQVKPSSGLKRRIWGQKLKLWSDPAYRITLGCSACFPIPCSTTQEWKFQKRIPPPSAPSLALKPNWRSHFFTWDFLSQIALICVKLTKIRFCFKSQPDT